MALEMTSSSVVCSRCGKAFSKRRGNFYVCHATLYKGTGFLNVCRDCIDKMFSSYLSQCKNAKDATRQMCRKLDLYWNENAYEGVAAKTTTRSLISQYLQRINSTTYVGKSYDDTLTFEGTLWTFDAAPAEDQTTEESEYPMEEDMEAEEIEVSEDVLTYWGAGYSPNMYAELEQRRQYWMSQFPKDVKLDVGTEAIIRQICSMELDINRARAARKNVDKSVATLNSLISALNSAQSKYEDTSLDKIPLGVMAKIIEQKHPIPEPSEKYKDADGIGRYVSTWYLGHVGKMLGKDTIHTRLYDDAIAKLRVKHPEFDDADDDELVASVFDPGGDEDD